MDSNFQVKITADLGDLVAKIKNIETTLKKLDSSFKTVGTGASDSLKSTADAAAKADKHMNRVRLTSFALGQVIRDAGFFTQSFGLGLLAISNNVPILIDQLVLLTNVSKGVGAAISLAGSVLTAVLTIWAYSSMAVDQNSKSLEKNKTVLDKVKLTGNEYYKTLDSINEARFKAGESSQKELTTLKLLYSQYTNSKLPLEQRRLAYTQMQQLYPSVFGNMKFEEEITGKVKTAYNKLTGSIIANATARAQADKIAKNANIKLEAEDKLIKLEDEKIKLLTERTRLEQALKAATKTTREGAGTKEVVQINSIIGQINKNLDEQKKLKADIQTIDKENLRLQAAIESAPKGTTIIDLETPDKGKDKESEKAKSVKRISDAYKELGNTLAFLSVDPTITQLERLRKETDAYKSLLETLFKEGFTESSQAVQNTIGKLQILGYEIEGIIQTTQGLEKANEIVKSFSDIISKLAESRLDLDTGSFTKASQKIKREIEIVSDSINKLNELENKFPGLTGAKEKIAELLKEVERLKIALGETINTETANENLKRFQQGFTNFMLNVTDQIAFFIGSTAADFAFALGEMFVTGNMGGFGTELLSSVADFLKSLGSQMVQFGTLAVLFGKLQIAMMTGDPTVKIAAGLALIGVGLAMSLVAGAISAGIDKNKEKKGKPFAKGGIVSTPTNALIGEYPGARRNPEVVAPLDKLKSLIGDNGAGSGGGFSGQLETRVSGNDLVILMNRASKNRNGYY